MLEIVAIAVVVGAFLVLLARLAVAWLNREGPPGEREQPSRYRLNVDSPGDDAR